VKHVKQLCFAVQMKLYYKYEHAIQNDRRAWCWVQHKHTYYTVYDRTCHEPHRSIIYSLTLKPLSRDSPSYMHIWLVHIPMMHLNTCAIIIGQHRLEELFSLTLNSLIKSHDSWKSSWKTAALWLHYNITRD